jgi:hypothetical protein
VTARVAAKPIIEKLHVRLSADIGRHELAIRAGDLKAADNVLGDIVHVGLATGEHVWTGLTAHVLDTANKEPRGAYGHEQAEPGDLQLPDFPLPDSGPWRVAWDGASGNEDEGDEKDDDNRENGAEDKEKPVGDSLDSGEGKSVITF